MPQGLTLEQIKAVGAKPKPIEKRGYTLEELQGMGAVPVSQQTQPQQQEELQQTLVASQTEAPPTIKQEQPQTSGLVSGVKTSIGERARKLEQAADFYGGDIKKLPEAALRGAGAAAGAVGDIGFEAIKSITPRLIKRGLSKGLEKVMQTPVGGVVSAVSQAGEEFAAKNPRAAEDIKAIFDLAVLIPEAKVAGETGKVLRKIGTKAVTRTTAIAAPKATNIPRTVTKAREMMYEVLRPEKGEILKMEIKRGRDMKEIAGEIAKKGIGPTIVDGKMDWKNGIATMRETIGPNHDALNALLEKTPGRVDLAKVAGDTMQSLEKTVKNAGELEAAKVHVQELLMSEALRYGDIAVPKKIANDIKSGMWQVGYDANKPMKNKIARQIGHNISDEISKGAPARVKKLNLDMSLAMDAIELMEKATGRVVKGGRVGQYAAGLAAAAALNWIPVIGPLGGFAAGKKIAEKVAERSTIGGAKKAGKLMQKAEQKSSFRLR